VTFLEKGVLEMRTIEKKIVRPMVTAEPNEKNTGYYILAGLAGVKSDSLEIDMGAVTFRLHAEDEKTLYRAKVNLNHEVLPENATAEFRNGILRVSVPFRETPWHRLKVLETNEASA
jgi:HSP20 family molecular chaperone IbpA